VARPALKVTVLGDRQDVEFLASVRCVAVTHHADLLEDVERPIDRRRDGRGVHLATSLDQLGTGHMSGGPGQDIEEDPALGRPTQPAVVQAVPHRNPARGVSRRE
jgi:hypothetical protein